MNQENFRVPLATDGSWDILEVVTNKVLQYNPGDIIEIGMGESTKVLAACAYQHDVKLYSCDLKMGGRGDYFDKPVSKCHHCFVGSSKKFMKQYKGNPSIVLLDGSHLYEDIKREVDFFLPRMKIGGVMFLHDTMPPDEGFLHDEMCGQAYKIRQDLEVTNEVDTFTWPYSALSVGLTMVMKHNDDRPDYLENGRNLE